MAIDFTSPGICVFQKKTSPERSGEVLKKSKLWAD
jgi:hypothetical protein